MHARTWLLLALGLCSGQSAAQLHLGPDAIPWPPSGDPGEKRAATRARWLFRPSDAPAAMALLEADEQLDLVATLPRFDELWIVEADAADSALVTSRWSARGSLLRDRSGVPQLFETTALIGAFRTWTSLDVWGDRVGTIAILDSGADTAHDDLGDRDDDNQDDPPQAAGDADDWVDADVFGHSKDDLVRIVGWHDVSDDMPGSAGPYDYERHGTALAGVAFGAGRVDVRYRGVAPQGRFLVVKTYNFEGQWQIWASDLLLGIDWVLAHRDTHRIRAVLIGASWDEDLGISEGVTALLDAGIGVLAPAGNDASLPMGYPALVEDVITVGATDELGRLAAYSRIDPGGGQHLDLLAPGGSMQSPNSSVIACDNEPNDSYRGRVGTSIAAAHVAGATSLLCQVLEESGRAWRSDRAQLRWLRSLLRATCVETEGAEPGAIVPPTLQRSGWDGAEGAGMLQARALVDAVRRTHWLGELEQIELQSPRSGDAVWAARVPVWGLAAVRVELLPPVDADFDLLLYEERDDGFLLRGASIDPRLGRAERIDVAQPRNGYYLLVVRRVSGEGTATLQSERVLEGDTGWPLQLSSRITRPAAIADLDGDGRLEIVAVNNLPIDASAHTWFAFDSEGRSFGLFPRTYFSASDRLGEVSTPAIGMLGGNLAMVSGSEFGVVYGVRASDAQLLFATTVSGAAATTGVVLGDLAPAAVAVGTESGIVLLNAAGAVTGSWSLGAPVLFDPLLIDLDDDGSEEIVFVEGQIRVHARRADGSALAGWPVALSGISLLGPPIGLGDGAGLRRVAWVEMLASGNSRLQLRQANGVTVPGFPLDFSADSGSVAAALGGVIATRAAEHGPTLLAAVAMHRGSDGGLRLALHRFDQAGVEQRGDFLRLALPAFAGSDFALSRAALSELRAVRISSQPEADWLFSLQFGWRESDVTQLRRYGSREGTQLLSSSGGAPIRFAATRDGHDLSPPLGVVSPSIADLDGDRIADLVIARGNRFFRQLASVPSEPAYFWSLPRVDARRSGCFRCGLDPVVAAPELLRAELSVAPNPFNPRTQIRWQWPRAGRVEFELYDARGRCVRTWVRTLSQAGAQAETFEAIDAAGRALASGVYRLRLRDAQGEISHSLTLVR